MTKDEKKTLLDAIDAAEKDAVGKAEAMKLPADVETVIYRLAAQVRQAVNAQETGDLPTLPA